MVVKTRRIKLQPDDGVPTAIDRIQKNTKFKRMMLFGLRALSELCVPPATKYKENSLASLEEGIAKTIAVAIKADANDEETGLLGCRILFGMTEGLKSGSEDELIKRFVDEGAVEAVTVFLGSPIKDEDTLNIALKCIQNIASLGLKLDAAALAESLIRHIGGKTKVKCALQLMPALHQVLIANPEVASVVAEKGISKILDYCLQMKKSDKDSYAVVEDAFNVIKLAAASGKANADLNLNPTMKLMDSYKSKKCIRDAGSAAMAAMLGPEQFKQCLKALSSAPDGSEQKNNALIMLSAMSYIDHYAESIVKAGSLKLLCEAVKKSSDVVAKGSSDPVVIAGLTGACKMLAAISRDPQHLLAVEEAGGLEAAISAIASVKDHAEVAAVCCSMLAAMSRLPSTATKMMEQHAVEIVLEVMKLHSKNAELIEPATEVLAAVSSHASALEQLKTLNIIPIVTESMKVSKTVEHQIHCVVAILNMALTVSSVRTLQEGKTFQGILAALTDHSNNVLLAQAASAVFAKLSTLPDANVMQRADIVDIILSMMLLHTGERTVQMNCKEALEVIATPEDVTRTLSDMEKAIMFASKSPARAFNSLAAVGGLSQIVRLCPIFEKQNAITTVLKGIETWIAGPAFNDQQSMISKGLHSVQNLYNASSGHVESILYQLMACAMAPTLRGLLDKQDYANNTALDILHVIRSVAASGRIESEAGLTTAIENMMSIMKNYQEIHHIQVVCMEILKELVSSKEAANVFAETGALKLVIAYMAKVAIHEDVQTTGLSLMHHCLKLDASLAGVMKRAGISDVVKVAYRTHGNKKNVGASLASLAAILMPGEEVEAEVKTSIASLRDATAAKDMNTTFKLISNMGALAVSPEAAHSAAKLGLGQAANQVLQLCAELRKKGGKNVGEHLDVLSETARLLKHAGATRGGCSALLAGGGLDTIMMCMEELQFCPDSETKTRALEDCTVALGALLRVGPPDVSEKAVQKNVIGRMISLVNQNESDTGLFGGATAAIAALRFQNVAKRKDYQEFINKLVNGMNAGSREHRLQCLNGLEELLRDSDMSEVLGNNGISALLKLIDAFADDGELVNKAMRCLDGLTKVKSITDGWLKDNGDGGTQFAIAVTRRVLQKSIADPECCAGSLNVLNRLCNETNKPAKNFLKASGIVADIQEALKHHPEHRPLVEAAGNILRTVGSDDLIKHLMQQIIEAVAKNSQNHQEIGLWSNELAFYLNAGIDDPRKALELSSQCADALAKVLRRPGTDTAAAAMAVSRRLAFKFLKDHGSPYGAKAIRPNMMAEISKVLGGIDTNSTARKCKGLVCNGFETLSALLVNPETRQPTLDAALKDTLLPKCDELLKVYARDPEVVACILNFKAKIGLDTAGANALCNSKPNPGGRALSGNDMLKELSAIMVCNRKNADVLRNGMEFVQSLLNGDPMPSLLRDPKFLRSVEAIADESPEALAAYVNLMAAMIPHLTNDEIMANLKRCIGKWSTESATMISPQKAIVVQALAQMIKKCAGPCLEEMKQEGVVDVLTDILETTEGSVEVYRSLLEASTELAKDGDLSAKLLKKNGEFYLESCLATIKGDPMACHELLQLLNTICDTAGNGQTLGKAKNFKNLIDEMQKVAADADAGEGHLLKNDLMKLSEKVENDTPEVLTLQNVFEKWSARRAAGDHLKVCQAVSLLPQFDYVADYTDEYSKTKHKDPKSELRNEFMYGCKCYGLLGEYVENCEPCIAKGEPQMMMAAIKRQEDEHVAQEAINAASEGCQHIELAKAFSATKSANFIASEALTRGLHIKGVNDAERETMLVPRILLIERLTRSRTYFNDTDAMTALIACWDDFDGGKYSDTLLRHVFRAMRLIVNEHFLPTIQHHNVPKRLVDIIKNKKPNIQLLPDVLFVLGTLASFGDLKTQIGELHGIEACLDLIRICLTNTEENTTRVQTNACLALSTLVFVHAANIVKFVAAKGPELNVEVMNKSMNKALEYDVCNGASILMCNSCFKMDTQKELYGRVGAPSAIMHTIKKYDGSDNPAALRCLNSMFKAIGNLALYTPNVTEFLKQNLEQTLSHFYTLSQHSQDDLVESSLRTVSNLVLENTEEAMVRFSVLIVPLLDMLRQGKRDTPSLLAMCFETLGCLCRYPENARKFNAAHGIETVLKILNNQSDESVHYQGIFVLGTQSGFPDSTQVLINNGVFNFIVALIEQQISKTNAATDEEDVLTMSTDLVVQANRCIRRLLSRQRFAEKFLQSGGLKAMLALLSKTNDHSMIHLESCRVLIGLLAWFPSPEPPKPAAGGGDGGWDAVVPDEGVLPTTALLDRPPSPRSWEGIGLQLPQVQELIVNLCTVLSKEGNAKLLRLVRFGLGLLAYLACEKIDGVVESFYHGNICTILDAAFKAFPADIETTEICCYIINNVAYTSDQAMYAVMKKDKAMRSSLQHSIKFFPKGHKVANYCMLTDKLLGERTLDTRIYEVNVSWDFPLEITGWDQDPYPNGVQDLPVEMRDEIRAGGQWKVQVDDKTKETLHWKGSFDMLDIQWRIETKTGTFSDSVSMSRLKTIAKGLASESFKRASGVSRINETVCLVLAASSSANQTTPVELNIVCPNVKARDKFFTLINEWREAASFGI